MEKRPFKLGVGMVTIFVFVSSMALLASAMTIFTPHPLQYLLPGLTTLMLITALGIYGSYAPILVLVAALAFLWCSALMISATVLHTRWVVIGIRAVFAIALLFTTVLTYALPIFTVATPTGEHQVDTTSLTADANSDSLQDTLSSLTQSGSRANPAYTTLLHDYTMYHAVLFIEGSMFALMLIVLSVYFWRRFKRTQKATTRNWTFEKKTYCCFGLASTVVALFMLVIVAANLSNVVNPQAGFAQSIPNLGTPQAGTQKAALYQAVNTWAQSGSAHLPSLLQNGVRDRLAWQQPKAIVCNILLVVFAVFTARVWQKLIKNSRANKAVWSLKEKARIMMGVIAVPGTLLLMILALANTQASFAPITLTLLFS